MRASEKQLILKSARYLVLRCLTDRHMHGYGVLKKIKKEFGSLLGPSTIYPLLRKLKQEKLVVCSWDLSHDRPRMIYSITDRGVAEYHALTEMIQRILRPVNEDIKLIRGFSTFEEPKRLTEKQLDLRSQ